MKPRLKVEFGLPATPNLNPVHGPDWFTLDRSKLDEVPLAEPWVDVTGWLRESATFGRGRFEPIDRFQTGTATFTLDNRRGKFDVWNAAGLADPERWDDPWDDTFTDSWGEQQLTDTLPLRPLLPVRMSAEHGGVSEPVWFGYVSDFRFDYAPGGDAVCVVDCVDGFGLLSVAELDPVEPSFAGDLPGERIGRVLDAAEVRYPGLRNVAAGVWVLGPTGWGVNALEHLQEVALSDDGLLFVDRWGVLQFVARTDLLNVDPKVTFTSGNGGFGVRLSTFSRDSATDLLVNRAVVETADGGRGVASDEVSVRLFNTRTLERRTLLANVSHAELLAGQIVARYGTPDQRVRTVSVNLHDPRTPVSDVLPLDVADRVLLYVSPPGVDETVRMVSKIDGVRHTVTPEVWSTQYWVSPADDRPYMVLGDAVFGRLDENRVAL
jgi:hypothetical protein